MVKCLYKNQERCTETNLWKFQLIWWCHEQENSVNAFRFVCIHSKGPPKEVSGYRGAFLRPQPETCFWRHILDQKQDGIATRKCERNQNFFFSLRRVQALTFLKIYGEIKIFAKSSLLTSNKLEIYTGIRTIIP